MRKLKKCQAGGVKSNPAFPMLNFNGPGNMYAPQQVAPPTQNAGTPATMQNQWQMGLNYGHIAGSQFAQSIAAYLRNKKIERDDVAYQQAQSNPLLQIPFTPKTTAASQFGEQLMKQGGPSPSKAAEMLRDGTANKKKLTKKQIKYFQCVKHGGCKKQEGGSIDDEIEAEIFAEEPVKMIAPEPEPEATPEPDEEFDMSEDLLAPLQDLLDEDQTNPYQDDEVRQVESSAPSDIQAFKQHIAATEGAGYFSPTSIKGKDGKPASSAYGKYQFVKDTRQKVRDLYFSDIPRQEFENLYKTSPLFQEQVMDKYSAHLLDKFKDPKTAATAFFLGEGAAHRVNDPNYNPGGGNKSVGKYLRDAKFQKGGKVENLAPVTVKGRTPIRTSNPNDPRLKKYQDSLQAYNTSLDVADKIAVGIATGYYNQNKVGPDKQHAEQWYKENKKFYRESLLTPLLTGEDPDLGGLNDIDAQGNFVNNEERQLRLTGEDRNYKKILEDQKDFIRQSIAESDDGNVHLGMAGTTVDDYENTLKQLARYDNLKVKPTQMLLNAELTPVLRYKKPVQPVTYKPLEKVKPTSTDATLQTGPRDFPVEGQTLGSPTGPYSITWPTFETEHSQQTSYFPDKKSWKAAQKMLGNPMSAEEKVGSGTALYKGAPNFQAGGYWSGVKEGFTGFYSGLKDKAVKAIKDPKKALSKLPGAIGDALIQTSPIAQVKNAYNVTSNVMGNLMNGNPYQAGQAAGQTTAQGSLDAAMYLGTAGLAKGVRAGNKILANGIDPVMDIGPKVKPKMDPIIGRWTSAEAAQMAASKTDKMLLNPRASYLFGDQRLLDMRARTTVGGAAAFDAYRRSTPELLNTYKPAKADPTGILPSNQKGGPISYNPNLAGKDKAFQKWFGANTPEGKAGIPYSDKLDYDMYSWYRNNPEQTKSAWTEGMHWPDTYKRPTHPTFSNESIYSTPENPGGTWDGETFIPNMKKGGHWIQGAINKSHKGYCTPMTKSTCTPRRKALARTFKKHHGFHQEGGTVDYMEGGSYYLSDEQIKELKKQGYELE